MDPEEKELLEEHSKLLKENNELLHKIHSSRRLSRIFEIGYWIIIIGTAFGAFYFVQPYIESVLKVYKSGAYNLNTVENITHKLNIGSTSNNN